MLKHEHLYKELKEEYVKVFVQYNRNDQLARFYFTLFLIRNYPKAEHKVIKKIANLLCVPVPVELIPGKNRSVHSKSHQKKSLVNLEECRKALNRLIEVKYGAHPPRISDEDRQLYRALDLLEKLLAVE